MTESVTNPDNAADMANELFIMAASYAERFGPRFARIEPLATEVPIRLHTGDKAPSGAEIVLASHLDLLFLDSEGLFGPKGWVVWDWKYRDEAPSPHYLARDKQLSLYWYMLRHGVVHMGSRWVELDVEGAGPGLAWCHLPHLRPFSRRTSVTDEAGEITEYQKGDYRPEKSVVRSTTRVAAAEAMIRREIMGRWAMLDGADVDAVPSAPTPTGCAFCDSERWCARGDSGQLERRDGAEERVA